MNPGIIAPLSVWHLGEGGGGGGGGGGRTSETLNFSQHELHKDWRGKDPLSLFLLLFSIVFYSIAVSVY